MKDIFVVKLKVRLLVGGCSHLLLSSGSTIDLVINLKKFHIKQIGLVIML